MHNSKAKTKIILAEHENWNKELGIKSHYSHKIVSEFWNQLVNVTYLD